MSWQKPIDDNEPYCCYCLHLTDGQCSIHGTPLYLTGEHRCVAFQWSTSPYESKLAPKQPLNLTTLAASVDPQEIRKHPNWVEPEGIPSEGIPHETIPLIVQELQAQVIDIKRRLEALENGS